MNFAAQQLAARIRAARVLGVATRRRRVPRVRPPKLIEADYAGRLVAILRRMRAQIERALPTVLIGLSRGDGELRRDEDVSTRGRIEAERVRREIEGGIDATGIDGIARDVGRRTAAHQAVELHRQARAALGVELTLLDPSLPSTIDRFVHENAKLISKLRNSTLDEFEAIITRAYASGTRAESVATEIARRFEISERHARLIARDQIGKLTGQVTAARHRDLGMMSYEWVSLKRPNARPHHVARHGKVFRYDKPPADGHPGEAICCACLQHPVFDELLGLAGAPESTPSAQPPPARIPRSSHFSLATSPVTLGGPLTTESTNAVNLAGLPGGRRAVWKPASGERPAATETPIAPGTYYKREVAASKVARQLGAGSLVPQTVKRTLHGEVGALQEFVEGAVADGKLTRASAERMRVFDFVIGNADRTEDNLLKVSRGAAREPRLIDNGLAFPVGPVPSFTQPFKALPGGNEAALLESTRKVIASIDLERLAGTLRRGGIEDEAIEHTLYRARYLQLNPDALSMANVGDWDSAARFAHNRLSDDEQNRIYRLAHRR